MDIHFKESTVTDTTSRLSESKACHGNFVIIFVVSTVLLAKCGPLVINYLSSITILPAMHEDPLQLWISCFCSFKLLETNTYGRLRLIAINHC